MFIGHVNRLTVQGHVRKIFILAENETVKLRKPFLSMCRKCTYTFTHTYAHTDNHFTALDFVQDNLGELVPEETFTLHTCHGHQLSLICFLHLLKNP